MAKWVCNLTWEDAPHLSAEQKKDLLGSYSPHERDARSKGLPQLGSGAIYPILEDDIVVEPFKIPDTWPRAGGMDVGWQKTACVWGAYDPKSDIWYLYSEYYIGYKEPSVHANGILARGRYMPILIDCHADRRGESGAISLLTVYTELGLTLYKANNGPNTLDAGILDVYQRLSSGRLKVFSHLRNWLAEYRIYRRDDRGRIVDGDDHLMDSTRFLVTGGRDVMECPPPDDAEDLPSVNRINKQGQSRICGY